ncbi:MAG: hypothetical protein AAF902_09930 [Chloroflexota bacterium]
MKIKQQKYPKVWIILALGILTLTGVALTTTSGAAANQQSLSIPQSIQPQCGGLAQEAENNRVYGKMEVIEDTRASEGQAVVATGDSEESLSKSRIDFCVRILEAGNYQVSGRILAKDISENSVFATINNQIINEMIWHVRPNPTQYETHLLSNGGSPEGDNPAVILSLQAGDHTFSIHQRETGILIDAIQFIQVDEQPTPVPIESCGELQQEAESGDLSGWMKIIEDGRASGGKGIATQNSQNNSLDETDRVDFCLTLAEAGDYHLAAWVLAPSLASNSMFVTIDNTPPEGMIWHMNINSDYGRQVVSSGGNPEGLNPGKTIYLEAGDHTISFYQRELGVVLDRFELVNGPAPDPLTDPTAIHSMLPHEAQIDYSNAGLTGGIPAYSNTIWVDGNTEADIEQAIQDAPPYTRIMLPAGTYDIGTINISRSHIALVGGGVECGETVLRFGSNDSGISVNNSGRIGSSVQMTASAGRNSKEVEVLNSSSLNVGDYVFIQQDDDPHLFRLDLSRNPDEPWAAGNATQINKIVAKDGNVLNLEGGLNLDYKTSLNARVAKIYNMVEGVGIENLTLERTVDDYAEKDSANVFFRFAANSWVSGVHSKHSVRAHVYFKQSYKGLVTGSYFDRSYNNGQNGHGYGVRLQNSTTDMLVENNIARLMRHSYITQIGANGNVFGYNYSADPFGEGFGEIYSDLSVHGGFAHSNLFEGNQAQHAKVDNIHASNAGNIFYRNRLEQDIDHYTYKDELLEKGASTPHIWIHENNYFNAFIANEISFPGANPATQTVGFDDGRTRDNLTVCKFTNSADSERGCGRTRETTVNHGTHDYLTGQTEWSNTIGESSFPHSAYLTQKPAFWGSLSPWPTFGPDLLTLSEEDKMIPAKARFLQGDYCVEQ